MKLNHIKKILQLIYKNLTHGKFKFTLFLPKIPRKNEQWIQKEITISYDR